MTLSGPNGFTRAGSATGSFVFPEVPEGSYTLTALDYRSFAAVSRSVQIAAGSPTLVDVSLPPLGQILVTATVNGAPLKDGRASWQSDARGPAFVGLCVTDSLGRCTLASVAGPSVRVRVEYPGVPGTFGEVSVPLTLEGQSAAANVSVPHPDAVSPVLVLANPAAGSWIKLKRPAIVVQATDNLTGVDLATATLTLDGTSVAGALSYTPPADLAEGTHTVQASVRDHAGNLGALPAGTSFGVDTVAPGPAALLGYTPGQGVSGTITLTAAAADPSPGSEISRIDVLKDGTVVLALGPPSFSGSFNTATVADGPLSLTARAVDRAGNVGNAGATLTLSVNNVALTVNLGAPANNAWVRDAVAAAASVSEPVDDVTFCVETVCRTVTAPPYTTDLDVSSVPEGDHLLIATAHGVETRSAQATIKIDRTAPAAPDVSRITATGAANRLRDRLGPPGRRREFRDRGGHERRGRDGHDHGRLGWGLRAVASGRGGRLARGPCGRPGRQHRAIRQRPGPAVGRRPAERPADLGRRRFGGDDGRIRLRQQLVRSLEPVEHPASDSAGQPAAAGAERGERTAGAAVRRQQRRAELHDAADGDPHGVLGGVRESSASVASWRPLLGDGTLFDFLGGNGAPGKIWDPTFAHANIRNGQTYLNGQPIDGTTTDRPRTLSLLSLVTPTSVTAGNFAIDRNLAGRAWWGDLAELIVYDRALSPSERRSVEEYLKAKYRIANMATPPVISPNGGLFGGSVLVSMNTQTPGAEIRYTLDGSEPTGSSPLYTAPFSLSQSTTVKAKTFHASLQASTTMTAGFTADTDVQPRAIAGLKLWWRSDAGLPSGAADYWEDQSGQGNHGSQMSSASIPSLVPNVANGLPVLRFDGTNDVLNFTTRLTGIRTVFWVVSESGAASVASWRPLLGDATVFDFLGGNGAPGKLWDPTFAHANVRTGLTYLNGQSDHGTTTDRPRTLSLISLVTAGASDRGQLRDRPEHRRARAGGATWSS
jgi:hypothetical protein